MVRGKLGCCHTLLSGQEQVRSDAEFQVDLCENGFYFPAFDKTDTKWKEREDNKRQRKMQHLLMFSGHRAAGQSWMEAVVWQVSHNSCCSLDPGRFPTSRSDLPEQVSPLHIPRLDRAAHLSPLHCCHAVQLVLVKSC